VDSATRLAQDQRGSVSGGKIHMEANAMEQRNRGVILTLCAIGFVLVAISNLLKPVMADAQTGFVFFGTRTTGLANDFLGPLFANILLLYAIGIWWMRKFALPMGIGYAIYVIENLFLFSIFHRHDLNGPPIIFNVIFVVGAIGISVGTAMILWRRRAELS
jgi:hypothetical protein